MSNQAESKPEPWCVAAKNAASDSKPEPLCVAVKSAAPMLDCSTSYVYELIEKGRLRRVTLGESSCIRIPIEDLHALANGRQVGS